MVFFSSQNFAARVDGDFVRKVALGHGGGDFGDVTNLVGQVAGHGVDRIGQILPDAGHAFHFRLAAELAFGADFARHARHFASERAELIHHGVDGVLQLQNFAARIHRNSGGQVALGHGRGDAGDVANLIGQVAGHGVHAFGQILPGAGDARHHRLAAQLAFGSHFARHARDFRSERIELVHHGVDHARGVQKLASQRTAVHFERHGLRQVALGDRADDAGDFGGGLDQVADQAVDRIDACRPSAVAEPRDARWAILPSLPTERLIRSNSAAICWLSSRISFRVSAILPSMPIRSTGIRIEKLPSLKSNQGLQKLRLARFCGLRRLLGSLWMTFSSSPFVIYSKLWRLLSTAP